MKALGFLKNHNQYLKMIFPINQTNDFYKTYNIKKQHLFRLINAWYT